jgi:alkylhydroperoxidase family enzyme
MAMPKTTAGTGEERLLIRMCDELYLTCSLSDQLWAELRLEYSEEALLELLMLAGFYRTISYLTNALRLPLEAFGVRFPRPTAVPPP